MRSVAFFTSIAAILVIDLLIKGDIGSALAMMAPLWLGGIMLGLMLWKKELR